MSDKALFEIQQLQFRDLSLANERLREFLNRLLPFRVKTVAIRPLAVSLNSINGFLTLEDGKRLFFKTHVEPQSIIDEYYNSKALADAGYPLILPIHSFTEWGEQLLIYEAVDFPSLFDVVRDIETGKRNDAERIVAIQEKADLKLLDLYRATLRPASAEENARSPIHQLFYHRLTGGRFDSFYVGKDMPLLSGPVRWERLAGMKWIVNGIRYRHTLEELVERAVMLLNPSQPVEASIIGHGDAHNGNVFLDDANNALVYFDPAFAGRHSPLLDLTKPLFHNVFAIWMYFPQDARDRLSMSYDIQGDTIRVEHNFTPPPVREGIFRSKTRRVLQPLLRELKERGWLASDWREYLKSALLCCPLLTMNLADSQKFPPEISLLGLVLSVVMGSESKEGPRGLLDSELELADPGRDA